MVDFTIVTGNPHKLVEYKRLLKGRLRFDHKNIDLEEIQSFDSKVIVEHKARQAYKQLKRPVLVEDVSAGLDKLNGLPGPFVKFFEEQLGRGALYTLAGDKISSATIICTIGLFDGTGMRFFEGIIKGQIVEPRVKEGFGFDVCFVPQGSSLTFAEMKSGGKDRYSHRGSAVQAMLRELATT